MISSEIANEQKYYAKYLFNTELYKKENLEYAQFDQPITKLIIFDTLERSSIVYVSPYFIKNLDLKIEFSCINGFQAKNNKGEIIIKNATWKEDYYGSISDSTEVPRLSGTAVLIRKDYYEELLTLLNGECSFVLKKEVESTESEK